jgi:glycerol kinase
MQPVHFALEGSVAVCGELVRWLRDKLCMISSAAETESLAESVDDCAGVVIVPAFSGLLAPYWRSDARGVIVGLTGFTDRRHIARAALEAAAFQSYELIQSLEADVGHPLPALRVDGGMTANKFLMQFQADILQKQARLNCFAKCAVR